LQRTLPNQDVPSYQHLIEFLKTRANGNQLLSKSKETKGATHKKHRHRQNVPRGRTFATTSKTLVCPTCSGPHVLRHCKVFKTKSAVERFQIVKGAALCINCLGSGHSLTQCTAGSCHICGQRHNTYLHREQTQIIPRSSSSQSSSNRSSSSRSSSGRSSSGRSSSGRSPGSRSSHKRSKRQSPPESSTSRSYHKSRRTTESSRKHTYSAPKDSKVPESSSPRTKGTAIHTLSKSQPELN
jgi:hypothetical protein